MPPTMLEAKLSLRGRSLVTDMGCAPLLNPPNAGCPSLIESNLPERGPDGLPNPPTMSIAVDRTSSLAWESSAFDRCVRRGDAMSLLVMLIGEDRPSISRVNGSSPNRGYVESSKPASNKVVSTYELAPPAKPLGDFLCHENRRSFSLSRSFCGLLPHWTSKGRGVPTGVLSVVEARSRSLVAGEK